MFTIQRVGNRTWITDVKAEARLYATLKGYSVYHVNGHGWPLLAHEI